MRSWGYIYRIEPSNQLLSGVGMHIQKGNLVLDTGTIIFESFNAWRGIVTRKTSEQHHLETVFLLIYHLTVPTERCLPSLLF